MGDILIVEVTSMKIRNFVLLLTVALVASLPIYAVSESKCRDVAGVLMTDIDAITPGNINLGPAFGDLGGAVSAQIVGQNSDGTFNVQHYWVTSSGDTILMKVAILHPTYPVFHGLFLDRTIVAVPWGNYSSDISGGTGKFDGATGTINYFGMADFTKNTLVLRYSGTVCYKNQQ